MRGVRLPVIHKSAHVGYDHFTDLRLGGVGLVAYLHKALAQVQAIYGRAVAPVGELYRSGMVGHVHISRHTLEDVQPGYDAGKALVDKAMPEVRHRSAAAYFVIPRPAKNADGHPIARLHSRITGAEPAVIYPKARVSIAARPAVATVKTGGDGAHRSPSLRILELTHFYDKVAPIPLDPGSVGLPVKGKVYQAQVVRGHIA